MSEQKVPIPEQLARALAEFSFSDAERKSYLLQMDLLRERIAKLESDLLDCTESRDFHAEYSAELEGTATAVLAERDALETTNKALLEALERIEAIDIGAPIGAVNPVYEDGWAAGWKNAIYWYKSKIKEASAAIAQAKDQHRAVGQKGR